MTDETGTVVKERDCLGICGSRGHHIAYGGKNLTAYFCRPRCYIDDHIDSAIESIEAYIDGLMADIEELWASEFDYDWWYPGDDDLEGDDDCWPLCGDDSTNDDDDCWPLCGFDWWPFGGDDSSDDDDYDDDCWPLCGFDWWPFGGDDGREDGDAEAEAEAYGDWWTCGRDDSSDNENNDDWGPFGEDDSSDADDDNDH